MWLRLIILALIATQSHAAATSKVQNIYARGLITNNDLQTSYDYIIAGGGLAGLVLASRLSEDASTSVLVLEAGLSGDAVADSINPPAGAYYSSIVGTDYDWQHVTVPQTNLSGRTIGWPRGKVLGGSSAMNAMYLVRPSIAEMDAWDAIIQPQVQADNTSAGNWGWDSMYGYMKKSENFTAPIPDLLAYVNISYNASTHGAGGPMQVSYPAMLIDVTSNWTSSLELAGVPELLSPNGGVTLGGFITPSVHRSLPPRSNLNILPEATVVRIVFADNPDASGNIYATAVEFAQNAAAARATISVNKEVILAGGALGSPKILMLSGVGPKDVLGNASVPLKLELPGVGQHLQDHLTAGVVWQTPDETAGNIHDSGSDFSKTPEFLSMVNDAVAFVNSTALFNGPATDFQTQILSALNGSAATLVPSQYPEVVEGYKAIYETLATNFLPDVAQLELLMSFMTSGTITIQSAIQHPFRYEHTISDKAHSCSSLTCYNVVIMRQGIKLVRTIGAAFGAAFGTEITPGATIQADADIDSWLVQQGANTQYHPTASCAMLPKPRAASLTPTFRSNVRVADSSVFPFEFAAHLGSATFGAAEQAAALIKTASYTFAFSHLLALSVTMFYILHSTL
ncbi:hypothetical protein BDZ97DRAFT_1824884 [Flammula alnicola]|nr:hypothetical protein BDZ97DRAFT_1824884 [Flammula alnicola]